MLACVDGHAGARDSRLPAPLPVGWTSVQLSNGLLGLIVALVHPILQRTCSFVLRISFNSPLELPACIHPLTSTVASSGYYEEKTGRTTATHPLADHSDKKGCGRGRLHSGDGATMMGVVPVNQSYKS